MKINKRAIEDPFERELDRCVEEVRVLLRRSRSTMHKTSVDTTLAKRALERFAMEICAGAEVKLGSSVHCLEIPTRVANALEQAGYSSIGVLVQSTPVEIRRIPSSAIGGGAVDQVRKALSIHGWCLRGDIEGSRTFQTLDAETLLKREKHRSLR